MAVELKISSNIKEITNTLTRAQKRHVPFATAKALTEVAITASKKTKTEMVKVFDRPNPYSLNSLRWQKATTESLQSKVWVKNKLDAGKGNSPEDYLLPEVMGGTRKLKRFERALIARRVMPIGHYAVIGQGAPMDAFGNIQIGELRRILSYFGAGSLSGGSDARTSLTKIERMAKRGTSYFVAGQGIKGGGNGKLMPGIYKRVATGFGSAIKPILIFVKRKPTYRERLNMKGIMQRTVTTDLPYEFNRAMKQAMETSGYRGMWK